MSLYLIVGIALVSALLSGAGIWKVQNWRHDSQDKARLEAQAETEKLRRLSVDKSAVKYEGDKERVRTVFKEVEVEVEKIVKEPFYVGSDLCLDDSGLQQLRAAARAADASSVPASTVPSTTRTR